MPRLLLINPSNPQKGLGNIKATAFPPLNIPYIAALTPKNYDIQVIDENIEPFRFINADIVGLTAYTASAYRAYQIAKIYRNKGIPTVIGGIHASMMPEEAMEYCDAVAIGEAESIWRQILDDFESGNLKRKYIGKWEDLNGLPTPRRDVLKTGYYKWGSIQTSRGCPMGCSFCSVSAFNGRRFRRRPLASVIEELEQIPQKKIMITDDNIIGYGKKDQDWAERFFSLIIEKNIKKIFFIQTSILFGENQNLIKLAARAGVRVALVGLESVNPNALNSYGKKINLIRIEQNKSLIKNIRKEGILFLGTFVIGGDEDDVSTVDPTLAFIKSSHIDILQLTKLTPLPGTELWKSLHAQERMLDLKYPEAWKDFRFTKMLYTPLKMSIEDINQANFYIKYSFFSLKETVKRTFSTLLATKSLRSTYISYSMNKSYKKPFRLSETYHKYDKMNLKTKFKNCSPKA